MIELKSEKSILEINTQNQVSIVMDAALAKINLNLNAHRILRMIISCIKPNDPENKIYRFSIDDFCKVYGLDERFSRKRYATLRKTCEELRSNINLPIAHGRITGFISWAQIMDGEVYAQFDPILLPYYKNQFATRYKLINITKFSSKYSFRFYELFLLQLKENKVTASLYLSLIEIKDWLELGVTSDNYSDFKRRILMPALNDINQKTDNMCYCNISVSFTEEKRGQKTVGLIFTIDRIDSENPMFEQLDSDELFDSLLPENQHRYLMFRLSYGISHETLSSAIKKHGEGILNIFDTVNRMVSTGKIRDKSSYAAKCLLTGVPGNGHPKVSSTIPFVPNRGHITKLLTDCGITDKTVILTILHYPDEYIKANIRYAIENYRFKKRQENIAGITLKAIKENYANFHL